jgi:preprotein translocase subunit SecE
VTETVGSTATPDRGNPEDESGEGLSRRDRKRANKAAGGRKQKDPNRKNVFARGALFYRQIIAELRKVVWPTRNDLTTYTATVIVFVLVIMAVVYGMDSGFSELAKVIFG